MHIIHLIFSMNIGGAQTLLVDTLNEQVKTNTVSLIVINDDYNLEILDEISSNVRIIRIRRKVKSRNVFPILFLNHVLHRLRPNIIHCHDAAIIKLLMLNGKPTILTVHDTGLDGRYWRKYNKLIAISKAVQEDIMNREGLSSNVVMNGIVCERIKQKTFLKRKDYFRIVQVSRLDTVKKGQDLLITAIHYLYKRGYNVCVDFIGKGDSEAELKQMVRDLKIEHLVSFEGVKDRSYIFSHLCEYDLFVQASRNEGFGLTVVEAMTAMLPVLVSDIEGPKEIIENGRYGFSFKSGDYEDCAKQIIKIIQNYERIDVEAAMNRANQFNISNTCSGYMDVYIRCSVS